jgi:hypothetical protein
MNMTICLLNRSIENDLIEVTHEDAWISEKSKVNHLKYLV